MPTEKEKLLPCPCCNGVTFIDIQTNTIGIRYKSVVCKDCGLATKYYCESSEQKAFNSWNTRATSKRGEKLREALVSAYDILKNFRDAIDDYEGEDQGQWDRALEEAEQALQQTEEKLK